MRTPGGAARINRPSRHGTALLCAIAGCMHAPPAGADVQIGGYGGANMNASSSATTEKFPIADSRTIDWDGKPFQMPPYWGARATYWWGEGNRWGAALDYTHAKAYARLNFATDPTYSHLEFTDGINLLTVNLLYRFGPLWHEALVPYVGVGAGAAIPHVEVTLKAFPGQPTFEYQLAGAVAQGIAGLELRLGGPWSLFAEGKLSYTHIDADLAGGGHLKTDLWTPQFAAGLLFRFGAD